MTEAILKGVDLAGSLLLDVQSHHGSPDASLVERAARFSEGLFEVISEPGNMEIVIPRVIRDSKPFDLTTYPWFFAWLRSGVYWPVSKRGYMFGFSSFPAMEVAPSGVLGKKLVDSFQQPRRMRA
jgi:hypothetical protein